MAVAGKIQAAGTELAGPAPSSGETESRPSEEGLQREFTVRTAAGKLIAGRILSFEDGIYEIATRTGHVLLPVEETGRIDVGLGGPPDAEEAPAPHREAVLPGTLRLAGPPVMLANLVPGLIEAFVRGGGGRNIRWGRQKTASERTSGRLLAASLGQDEGGADKVFRADVLVRQTSEAANTLFNGEADIVIAAHQIFPEEEPRPPAGRRPQAVPAAPAPERPSGVAVAPGAAVIIVHPSNPVKALRFDQIADIFSGRVRDWSEVGGAHLRIQLYRSSHGGLLDVVQRRAMNSQEFSPDAREIPDNLELAEYVAADPGAIGVVEQANTGNAAAVPVINECGTLYKPVPFALQTEEYPFTTHIYFYTPAQATPLARQFIAYVLSEAGQKKIQDLGLTGFLPSVDYEGEAAVSQLSPAGPLPPEQAVDPRIVTQLTQLQASAKRISIVLRFGLSGTALDSRGEHDIGRLAAFLKTHPREGHRLALVGFSDATGGVEKNVVLSENRAKLVAKKLAERGVTADFVAGVGPLLPVVCGTSPEAIAKNRRVEAWFY